MVFSLVVASNDQRTLDSCLLASPALGHPDVEVIVERSAPSAAHAYNAGTRRAGGDIVVYAHQDVLLPANWFAQLSRTIEALDADAAPWGVLGVLGVDARGICRGTVYSTGLAALVGVRASPRVLVRTLDEVVLVVRRVSALTFDEGLPGFHLYGTDLCLEAYRRGLTCYAIDAGCVHNSNGIGALPPAYWRSWLYVRRKWRDELPVLTPCMSVTRWGAPALRYLATRSVRLALGGVRIGRRLDDPRYLLSLLPGYSEDGL